MRVFNGKEFARRKERELQKRVLRFKKTGKLPELVSVNVGANPESRAYLRLKQEAAKRVGIKLKILKFPGTVSMDRLTGAFKKLNQEKSVGGLMIQLPLPETFSNSDRRRVVNSISKTKDVDGMRDDSPFVTPVVLAVVGALEQAQRVGLLPSKVAPLKVVVVGSRGFVGKKIVKALKNKDLIKRRVDGVSLRVEGYDIDTKNLDERVQDADMVISATGKAGLIKKEMVKRGSVLIDVGSPKGDIDRAAYSKALFLSPVPGGIGPVTISFLLENFLISVGGEVQKVNRP